MMKLAAATLLSLAIGAAAFAAEAKITPIQHASFIAEGAAATLYFDPVGDAAKYKGLKTPDLLLITHHHADHFQPELVKSLLRPDTRLITNKTVAEQLGAGEVMANGDEKKVGDITIQAIPAYNTTADRLNFHPKGRDNGYVITMDGNRIYVSGDTEDIPEMRALKNIDMAFVCMNLPFTMSVEQAASAVLEFKPKVIIPYHFKGKEGFSNLEKFKELVSVDKNIEVRILPWYQ